MNRLRESRADAAACTRRSKPLRPKVLITRKIFEESIAYLARHCDVETNQRDVPLTPHRLIRRLQRSDRKSVV